MKIQPEFHSRHGQELRPTRTDGSTETAVAPTVESTDDDTLLDGYSRTISAVVNRVAPTVVNIRVEGEGQRGGGGSGFLIARDGFILTNAHVTHEGRKFEVTLHDARVVPEELKRLQR